LYNDSYNNLKNVLSDNSTFNINKEVPFNYKEDYCNPPTNIDLDLNDDFSVDNVSSLGNDCFINYG